MESFFRKYPCIISQFKFSETTCRLQNKVSRTDSRTTAFLGLTFIPEDFTILPTLQIKGRIFITIFFFLCLLCLICHQILINIPSKYLCCTSLIYSYCCYPYYFLKQPHSICFFSVLLFSFPMTLFPLGNFPCLWIARSVRLHVSHIHSKDFYDQDTFQSQYAFIFSKQVYLLTIFPL